MSQGRLYSVAFIAHAQTSGTSCNAFGLYTTTMPFAVHAITLCTDGLSAVTAGTRLHFNRLAPTVTPGSGGSVVTPVPMIPGDPASSITAHVFDNVTASTTGANDSIIQDDWSDMTNNWWWEAPPDNAPECYLNGAIVLTLNVLGATSNLCGTILFEELA